MYYWRQGDNEQNSAEPGSSRNFSLTGLRAYTNYTINVTAVNDAEDSKKEGPAATVRAQTLIAGKML